VKGTGTSGIEEKRAEKSAVPVPRELLRELIDRQVVQRDRVAFAVLGGLEDRLCHHKRYNDSAQSVVQKGDEIASLGLNRQPAMLYTRYRHDRGD